MLAKESCLNKMFWPEDYGGCCCRKDTSEGLPVKYDDFLQIIAPCFKHDSRTARWVLFGYRASAALLLSALLPVARVNGGATLEQQVLYFTYWGYYSTLLYFWAQTFYGVWFMYKSRHEATDDVQAERSGPFALWKFISYQFMWC